MEKKKKRRREKPINWVKQLKRVKEMEQDKDVARILAIVKELHWILFIKNDLRK